MASPQQTQDNRRGCLIGGCATLTVLFALITAGSVAVYNQAKSYTTTQPPDLPVHAFTEDEATQLQNRIREFGQGVESNRSATLVLTADDLNTLISRSELKDKVYLSIIDDQLIMQGGVSLDRLPGFSGRYINGTYTLDISLSNGELRVTPTDFSFEEDIIPDNVKREIVAMLKEENLAEELLKRYEVAKFVDNMKEISIENNNIVVVAR